MPLIKKEVKAILAQVRELPANGRYPNIQGNLSDAIWPFDAQLLEEQATFSSNFIGDTTEPANLLKGIMGRNRSAANERVYVLGVGQLGEVLRDTVATIRKEAVPAVRDLTEEVAEILNDVDYGSNAPVIKTELANGLISNQRVTAEGVSQGNQVTSVNGAGIAVSVETITQSIALLGADTKLVNESITSSNPEDPRYAKEEFISLVQNIFLNPENIMAETLKSKTTIEVINLYSILLAVFSGMVNNVPRGEQSFSLNKYQNLCTQLIGKTNYILHRAFQKENDSSERNNVINKYCKETNVIKVNLENYTKLSATLETDTDLAIIGAALTFTYDNENTTLTKLTEDATRYVSRAKSFLAVDANVLESKRTQLARQVVLNEFKASILEEDAIQPSEVDVFGEAGNPSAVHIATKIVNEVDDAMFSDTALPLLIAKVVCEARFPHVPAYAFIQTMVNLEKTHPDVNPVDAGTIAIANMIGDFIADNLLAPTVIR